MYEVGEYLERKSLADYIQNVVKLEAVADDTWKTTDGITISALSNYITASLNINQKAMVPFEMNPFDNSPFLSKIVKEENIELPQTIKSQVNQISNHLKIGDEVQKDIEKLLQKLYISNAEREINISMSADRELLIYLSVNDTYKNILVSEDGDIELLIIPSNKSKSYNKTFYKEDGLNLSKVVSTFNEMR
jgi:hypothetical protein